MFLVDWSELPDAAEGDSQALEFSAGLGPQLAINNSTATATIEKESAVTWWNEIARRAAGAVAAFFRAGTVAELRRIREEILEPEIDCKTSILIVESLVLTVTPNVQLTSP